MVMVMAAIEGGGGVAANKRETERVSERLKYEGDV